MDTELSGIRYEDDAIRKMLAQDAVDRAEKKSAERQ